jgi:hypothetical protein
MLMRKPHFSSGMRWMRTRHSWRYRAHEDMNDGRAPQDVNGMRLAHTGLLALR